MKKSVFILVLLLAVLTTCQKEDEPVLASLTTIAVTNITINSAESGGVISNDGNSPITSKGIVWGKTSNPTLESNIGMASNGQGTSDFKSNLDNLQDNTDYFARAFATNKAGTAYGNQQTFKTLAILLSSVTTNTINISTKNSAVLSGTVSSDGGASVTEIGFYWGINENPETSGTKIKVSGTSNQFTYELTGLEPGKTYYVKAYAVNSKGQSVGNQINFKTDADIPSLTTKTPTSVTSVDAILGGSITSDNGASVTERGIYWSTSENPESTGTKLLSGSGTTDFSVTLQNLLPNTTYYIKSFASNSKGTGFGELVSFKTKELKLAIIDVSKETEWEYWVIAPDGSNFFVSLAANNLPDKVYYKPDKNKDGYIVFFNDKGLPSKMVIEDYIFVFDNFRENLVDVLRVSPTGETSIFRDVKSDLNLSLFNLKSANNTTGLLEVLKVAGHVVGIASCIAGMVTPVIQAIAIIGCGATVVGLIAEALPENFQVLGITAAGVGAFADGVGCITGQLYECGFAAAQAGIAYSAYAVESMEKKKEEISTGQTLLTSGMKVITNLVISNSSNSALVGGVVTNDGITNIIERGVYYGKLQNPETNGAKFQIGSGTGSFSNTVTGLEANTTYYVKAYAKSSQKTEYGNQVSFKTQTAPGSAPVADFTASKTNPAKGETVQFTDKSTNSPTSWLWDFGDGTTSTQQNPTKTYNNAGTFTVSLRATNSYGSNSKTLNIAVKGSVGIVPTNGLIAYYPFNGNANDESGNANNGTVNNATLVNGRKGNANSAYELKGTGSKIVIADNPVFNSSNQITVSVWANPTTTWTYNAQHIISKEVKDNYGFCMGFDQNNSVYGSGNYAVFLQIMKPNGYDHIYKILTPAELPGWKNIVFTIDGNTMKIFLNGNQVAIKTVSTNLQIINSGPINIGTRAIRTDQWYKGYVDDVRIYNRALTEAEIKVLYEE